MTSVAGALIIGAEADPVTLTWPVPSSSSTSLPASTNPAMKALAFWAALRFGPPLLEEAGEEVVAAGAGTEAEPEDEAFWAFGGPMHMCPFLGSPHTLHLYTTIDADARQEKKIDFLKKKNTAVRRDPEQETRNKCR